MNNNKKILECINKILNDNINKIIKFKNINSSPQIHYIDFDKLKKYKSSPKPIITKEGG
jgi:hypothetical protein